MEEDTKVTTTPIDGSPEGTGSQAANKAGQPDNQSQTIGTSKVEGGEQHTSSSSSERPKASEFYKAREHDKKWKQSLEGKVQQLSGQLTEIGSVLKELRQKPPDEPKFLTESEMQELLVSDPIQWAQEKERKMKHDLEKTVKQVKEVEVPNILKAHDEKKEKQQEEKQFEIKGQEALELLFPKTGSDDTSKIDERKKRSPERTKRIIEILEDTGLTEISLVDPIKAAKSVLMILDLEAKVQRPNSGVTTKSQLGAVIPTGTIAGNGGSKTMTLEEIKSENDKMYKELDNNPDLRYDEKWVARRDSIKKELGKIIEEGQKSIR